MDYTEGFLTRFGGPVLERWKDHIMLLCPQCRGKSLACHILKGLFVCFKCNYKGRLRSRGLLGSFTDEDSEERFLGGIPSPPPLPPRYDVLYSIISLCDIIRPHRDYLISRGIYDPSRYLIRSVPSEEFLLYHLRHTMGYSSEDLIESGFVFRGDDGRLRVISALRECRILIPNLMGPGVVTGFQTRRSPSDVISPRYLSAPSMYPSGLWMYRLPPCAVEESTDIFVVEGVNKAIVLDGYGYTAIGLAGTSSWRRYLDKIRFMLSLFVRRRVFVVFDTDFDSSTRRVVMESACELAAAIGGRVVSLPLLGAPGAGNGIRKQDVDTFLLEYGRKAFDYLVEDAWCATNTR